MDIVLPTPQRIAKGDLVTYESDRGGIEIKSNVVSYHERLYRERQLTPRQYLACQSFIELHHNVFAPMGHRSVHELLLRRAEGSQHSYIEKQLSGEDQYFRIMHHLDYSERVAALGLLINGDTVQQVASRMYRGRRQVKARLISAAGKIADQLTEIRKLNG